MAERGRKILILTSHIGEGGVGRVITRLAQAWLDAGDEVLIVTPSGDNANKYIIPEGVRSLRIGDPKTSNGVWSTLVRRFVRMLRLRQVLRSEKPDIAIGMMMHGITLGFARTRGMIAIGAEHTYPPYTIRPTRTWTILRKWAYRRLDAVAALTDIGRDWLIQNTHARRIVTIPNWIELPIPRQEPELPVADYIPKGRRILLAAGRLSAEKAFDRLIAGFGRLAAKHPDWMLAIPGEGRERAALEQLISDLDLQGRVVLPGRAGNIADWYGAADLFALTSQLEGFPSVLIEALAHGCPAVSVDCNTGPRDIIKHEENGLLVPQNDPEALVIALDRMMSDAALRERFAAHTPEVLEIFSRERVLTMWEELFASFLCRQENRQESRRQ